jgi:hypothetical protein
MAQGRTAVDLNLGPRETLFVVFRGPAHTNSRNIPTQKETELATVGGPWSVSFDKGPCAPAPAQFEKLASWSDSTTPAIKYFSGTATYEKSIRVSAAWLSGKARVWIELGSVKNLAEVIVNGKSAGIAWKPPFRVDVTPALKTGENRLAVSVTDLWANRLIGDLQPGGAKCAFADPKPMFYQAASPLLPAGLLGPVRIVRATE